MAGLPTARIVAALVLAPIVIAAIVAGEVPFLIMVVAAVTVLAWEWLRMCDGGRFLPRIAVFLVPIWLAIALMSFGQAAAAVAALTIGFGAVWYATGGSPWSASGVLYFGLPGVALVWLRSAFPDGEQIVLWLFLVVWASDIGAYVAGRWVGGPKLAPGISPNKTWAGAIGALVLAAACGATFAHVAKVASPVVTMAASVGLSVVAQAGDLAESRMKRHFGIKDTGSIIPGHGGLLDRLDSLLLGATVIAAAALVGKVPM